MINFIKNYLIVIFIFFLSSSNLSAKTVKEIIIDGNERVNSETIKVFGGVTINDDLNSNDLNSILKKLYKTNFLKVLIYH